MDRFQSGPRYTRCYENPEEIRNLIFPMSIETQKGAPFHQANEEKADLTGDFKDAVNDILEIEDLLDGLEALEAESWPEGTRAGKKEFLSRVRIFPDGVFYYRVGRDFGGLSTSMIVSIDDPGSIRSWEAVTDYGMISSHNPKGNTLYIVSVGTSPRYRGRGIGKTLVSKQIELAESL